MLNINDQVKQKKIFGPWIMTRLDKNCQPKYKLLSRQLHLDKGPTLTIHTAGQHVVWEISIQDAATDNELLKDLLDNMDEMDVKAIQWVFQNDFDIENYNYKKSEFKD